MKCHRLDDMVKGWFIGNFSPAVAHSESIEVGVKDYKAGDCEPEHFHKIAVEYTVIISGQARMCDRTFSSGDIVIVSPGEATAFEALTDVVTVVVKIPSAKNDKYFGRP